MIVTPRSPRSPLGSPRSPLLGSPLGSPRGSSLGSAPGSPTRWIKKRVIKNIVLTPSRYRSGQQDRDISFDLRFPIEITTDINAATAHRDSVRVEARAPSGRVQEMGIGETNGVYTANFTPDEVGVWRISIFCDGQHIQGSPFNVRVYDAAQVKVFGLEGGAVGKDFSFSADCSNAGDGELTVEIKHNGHPARVNITPDGHGIYRIGFKPEGPGIYAIRVYFAGMEVSGSPYTLEIVDSHTVTASGDGLSNIEVNRRAAFIVKTQGSGGSADNIRVTVRSPRGQAIPSQIYANGDDTYRVEYVPTEVGEYLIDVLYYGKDINGSPFRASAFDWNRIAINNLTTASVIGKPVEFDINASQAGSGNLEIMVNEGTIPCSVQNRGHRQFHASFVPKDPIPHHIQMKFNGREVPGSPWRVDIRSAAHVTTSGQGLQMVSARSTAAFDVQTGGSGPDGSLVVTVLSPSGRRIPVQVINNHNGSYRVEYTATEVGNHTIDVLYDGMPVPNSPFISKVYDSDNIVVSNMPSGIIGKPVELTIDVTQGGEGQLEIMVNRGSVPNTVKMLRKGVFLVTFVPRDNRPHQVDIKFNGELLPHCPLSVPILDASRVTVHGDGLRQVAVNRSSYFRVNTQSAGDADLSVRVTSPTGELVPAKMVTQPDGDFKVEYSSKYTGRHTVEIMYAGQAIMGSPFFVEIYDPNKIRVEGVKNGTVDQPINFDILRHEAGKAELGLTITAPSGASVPYQSQPGNLGDRILYTPHEVGQHLIYLTYGGLDVPGCPLSQNIVDGGSVAVFGDGLTKGLEGKAATFFVEPQGKRGDLWVQVDGPNSIAKCNIEPDSAGRYVVSYVPVECGIYIIQIKWNNRLVPGSPFRPNIVDPAKLQLVGGWQSLLDAQNKMVLKVNEMKKIEFNTAAAGPGIITAELRGPNGPVPCEISQPNEHRYIVSFVPRTEGEHYLSLWWSEVPLPRSPIAGYAYSPQASINSDKVILTGHGLLTAQAHHDTEFVIDGTDAGEGQPEVKLTGVKEDIRVIVTPLSARANCYRCTYTPNLPGAYLLNITWSERQVRGSPFKVTVTASSDATKVACEGEGLKVGIMGKEIKSVIDTRRAGPGELEAHCMGPSKVAYCELFDHHDGTFTLNIKPQEAGKHILQIKYGGEHVPGSPYTLRVSGAPDASKVRVSGPGIEHGILATYQSRFMVETRGAGAGQLTVRIRGPKGSFRVEMSRESQRDRTIMCRYDPTEVGDYIINVKWSGEHVPGSPYRVQIYDTQQELEAFMSDPGHGHNTLPAANRSWEGRDFDM